MSSCGKRFQWLVQIGGVERDIRHAVLENAGTIISFRVGAEHAPYLEPGSQQLIDRTDLGQLANHRIFIKMMIDGMPSNVFSATTLKPWQARPSD
jgi:hypothetical protein